MIIILISHENDNKILIGIQYDIILVFGQTIKHICVQYNP